MEIFELKYFLGVARDENVHKASRRLRVSPAALSKAIKRLEGELSVSLFSREGRNIKLTDHGRLFQRRASEIVQLEESARLEVSGHLGAIHVVIAGPEILLAEMGVSVSSEIKARYPLSSFEYHAVSDEKALGQLERGEAQLALVTSDIQAHRGLTAKLLSETMFQTVVGPKHELFAGARAKKVYPVEKILEYAFVSPSHPLLGKIGLKQSLDGWRDDKFPRRVEYLTSSLKMLETLVLEGKAIAYLPDYHFKRLGFEVLKISGCPYSCAQKIRLVARNPRDQGWLNRWF